ncbi:MAG: carotenoid 1,2-hydratase [Gammaproteobacteria bacterium]|nr:carotenoid 1,2-hydratase [Gammaproteobacteria bacterium]
MLPRALVLSACLMAGCGTREALPPRFDVTDVLSGGETQGYRLALAPREFHFPRDHGTHPGFRDEWWYVTGNLEDASGRPFGFQVTFFRFAVAPGDPRRTSAWGTNQVWMAHLAVSDIAAGEHLADERMARGALGLAGAQHEPFRVWVEDWEILGSPGGFPWRVRASTETFGIDLTIQPEKPIVLQGDRGLIRKSAREGNASYYYSITRLRTRGQLRISDRAHVVTGSSWLDREWGTSSLGADQEGWDWFALQLEGNRELMFYRIGRRDGSIDPMSCGVLVDADGKPTVLSATDVSLRPLRTWRGPGNAPWPVKWRLSVPAQDIDWIIDAAFDDQLVDLAFRYWEGSVRVREADGGRLAGRGYLESTGYGGARVR